MCHLVSSNVLATGWPIKKLPPVLIAVSTKKKSIIQGDLKKLLCSNKVIDGQRIFLMPNGVSMVKYFMLTTKKDRICMCSICRLQTGTKTAMTEAYLTQKYQ